MLRSMSMSLRRMCLCQWPCLLAAMLHLLAPLGHAARHLPRDFTSDTAGNRTGQSVTTLGTQPETANTTYSWDAQDRLASVTLPDGSTHSYAYDYRTRRTAVRTLLPTLQQTLTAIVFAGGLSLAEYAEASSEPLTAHAPTVEYTRGPDMGGGVGGLLYSSRHEGSQPSPTLRYALSNGRGDIVAQADQNAVLTWTASYEAYGKRTRESGSNADKQRANSNEKDARRFVGFLELFPSMVSRQDAV